METLAKSLSCCQADRRQQTILFHKQSQPSVVYNKGITSEVYTRYVRLVTENYQS